MNIKIVQLGESQAKPSESMHSGGDVCICSILVLKSHKREDARSKLILSSDSKALPLLLLRNAQAQIPLPKIQESPLQSFLIVMIFQLLTV